METFGAQIISENSSKLRDTILYLRKLKIFDEIVAIGDLDAGKDIYESAKLADRFSIMNVITQDQAVMFADSLSTTDWRFRIDDDERMGEKFVSEIKKLIESNTADCLWLARMWLYPTKDTFISCYQWYPDFQLRVWKNGYLKPPEGVHSSPIGLGRNGKILLNIFHYRLITDTYEQRLAHCERYAKLMNVSLQDYKYGLGAFYLPEESRLPIFVHECYEKIVE